jgi:primosomal protein N' (replication factor Y)
MSRSSFAKYAAIVLDVSIDKWLDYGLSSDQIVHAKRGIRVEVPVRGRLCQGYIMEIKEKTEVPHVKGIARILSETDLITEELFELALWMSRYYCAPLRQVFKAILPAIVRKETKHKQQWFVMRGKTREQLKTLCEQIRGKHPAQAEVLDVMLKVKKGILLSELLEKTQGSRSPIDTLAKKGYLILDIVRVNRSPLINEQYFQTKPKQLNEEQDAALKKMTATLQENRFETHLLHGVTGSGKTEVYLQAIDKALSLHRGVIMLVPEISLTAQTIERFRSRFEGKIAILHHQLSAGERFDEWHKIRRGEAEIVIGARSAIFSPVQNLGLIIVDEEHEHSYKQSEEAPCYHARDVAVMRGKMSEAAVILGSATPSLESYYNASTGKYTLSPLLKRADAAHLPTFTIIDMKVEFEKAKGYTNFSSQLLNGIKNRQSKGEQVILFLNRRGYHTTLLCPSCGKAVRCQHCDISLTFHLGENCLSCHLCGFRLAPPPAHCPLCQNSHPLKFRGVGTEQVEKALHAILPEVRTLRIDADTTRHKGSHQKLLRQFGTGKADVLIGTQMIAKGLHFPEVTLVGVLNSDAGLNIPDFRAAETVFQLITQVAGRAGRGRLNGEVIVQTCMPDNATIQLAAKQDFSTFYFEETAARKIFGYPPFSHLVKLTFSGPHPDQVRAWGEEMRIQLLRVLPPLFEINALIPAGYPKIKDQYRFQLLIRGPHIYPIAKGIDQVRGMRLLPREMNLLVDINPTSTFF